MTPQLAQKIVEEITGHITTKLRGVPGVTKNSVANLVFGWLRQEQQDVLEVLSSSDIRLAIEEFS